MQGVFTKFLQLWIPNKTDKGSVVTDVFEPNFTKLDQNAETTNQTLTDLGNNKLDKGTYPGTASNLKTDISGKLDKYKDVRETVNDYDDLIEDGFYIVSGSIHGVINSPHLNVSLVQVWSYNDAVYQKAVSYYDIQAQFVRCIVNKAKNTKWEKIVNTANYSLMCPYGIGDLMLSASSQHPAVRWVGTTWEKIEDRFLLSTSGSGESGTTGGSNTKTITQANLPNIKLQVDSFSLGRGTQEITGQINYDRTPVIGASGAFVASYNGAIAVHTGVDDVNRYYDRTDFTASSAWTGMSTSASPFTETLGSGTPLDITPSFYTVHIWKRLT